MRVVLVMLIIGLFVGGCTTQTPQQPQQAQPIIIETTESPSSTEQQAEYAALDTSEDVFAALDEGVGLI
jgi:hypothetical protein